MCKENSQIVVIQAISNAAEELHYALGILLVLEQVLEGEYATALSVSIDKLKIADQAIEEIFKATTQG